VTGAHVCDVAGCERGYDTIAEVIEHERTHVCGKRSFVHARPMPHTNRDGRCEFCGEVGGR
jgi:hypothetical protein